MELVEVSRKEIQVWRSCNLIPKRTKNTYWKIYQEVVWSIQNIVLLT